MCQGVLLRKFIIFMHLRDVPGRGHVVPAHEKRPESDRARVVTDVSIQ